MIEASWQTIAFVPTGHLQQWATIFLDALLDFVLCPDETCLCRLYLESKLLLGAPTSGGHAKTSAMDRLLRKSILRWQAGDIIGI